MKELFRILLVFVFIFPNNYCFSEASVRSDTDSINGLLKKLDVLSQRNLDSAMQLGLSIQKESNRVGYQKGIWESMIIQGTLFSKLGLRDSSIVILTHVLEQAESGNDRLTIIKAHLELAWVFKNNYEFDQAVSHLINAERLLENSDPFELRFKVLNNLGSVHRKLKDYTSALKYFEIINDNYFFQLNTEQRFNLFMNTGNVYADMHEFSKTEELFNKAYHEIQKIDKPASLALISYNLGALYYRQTRFDEAEELIAESLNSYTKIGDKIHQERCYRVLGAINMDQRNHKNAEVYYLKALAIAKEINNPKSILGNYNNLFLNTSEIATLSGKKQDFEKALEYQAEWANLNDSLYKADLANQILELEKKYETEKKNNEISLLEKENQIKEDQLEIQKVQRNSLLIFVVFVLAILGIFVYAYYYYRRVNKLLQKQSMRILYQKSRINEQNQQLQKSVDTQNKLFSIIAHDLRSPLISLSNFTKLINFYLLDNRIDEIREMAVQMDRKNDHVLELTDNLLSWAKGQSGSLSPLLEKLSLKKTVEECLDIYHPLAEDKGIELRFAETNDYVLWADRNMVKTICRNLVNNAIKFTPRDGIVSLAYELQGDLVKTSVSDTGIGMDDEQVKLLFDIDRKKTKYGTEGEESSGLGLSVCKEFVEKLGGEILVASKPDVGSTFSFTLPIYSPERHHEQSTKKRETRDSISPSLN